MALCEHAQQCRVLCYCLLARGYLTTGQGSCVGGSGEPVVSREARRTGSWLLTAVSSVSTQNCAASLLTRVAAYTDWILVTVGARPPRTTTPQPSKPSDLRGAGGFGFN